VRVGSKVKITGSKYATGQTIPDWVKSKTYTVQQIAGDKALIKEIVSWVFTKDLMLI
jgi:TusA-related sulfurtransferase